VKVLMIVVAALVALGCGLQNWSWPVPPSTKPTPAPTPTPKPVLTCASMDCAAGFHCVESDAGPQCVKDAAPPVVEKQCPATPPEGSVRIVVKIAQENVGSGKRVLDATPRVADLTYCSIVSAAEGIWDCKANPEGSGYDVCDRLVLGANCPYWKFKDAKTGRVGLCLPEGLGEPGSPITCDHFDGWKEWRWVDDADHSKGQEPNPYTGRCETIGGVPVTGFEVVPHGEGTVQACTADGKLCSGEVRINY
jgi:hypothetical protein